VARPLVLGVERPPCPDGHAGRIWLRGKYVGESTGFERTRFTCVPADPTSDRHNFTAVFSPRRPNHDHRDDPDFECDVCERDYKRAEGARTPHSNLFSVREMADTLVNIGQGKSYRESSRTIRRRIGRISTRPEHYRGEHSNNANLAIAFLDGFGEIVTSFNEPDHWPETVVLDSWPFRQGKPPEQLAEEREAKKKYAWPKIDHVLDRIAKKYRKRGLGTAAVFVAVGYQPGWRRGRPWLARVAGSEDEDSWEAFMRLLPGQPRWVISDRAKAIASAAARAWPDAYRYACEYHLFENAEQRLFDDDLVRRDRLELDPLWRSVRGAFKSPESWEKMKARAIARKAVALLAWIDENEELVLRQMNDRQPEIRVTNGAAESFLFQMVAKAFKGRLGLFRNIRRLDKLLALIQVEATGAADGPAYSRLIRAHLAKQEGRSQLDWKAYLDRDHADSIYLAMVEANARHRKLAAERNRVRDAPGKAARHRASREDYEKRRLALGLGPSPRGRPRQPKLESVRGMTVADIPWLLAEWHSVMNEGLDPATVKAGTGDYYWWKCPYGPDHEWQAQPRARALLAHGCPFCTGRITARSESLALTHPEIAAEWHPTRNNEITPWDKTWGSHFEAWWTCPTGFKTHDYQSRIASRTTMLTGCPTCALRAGKGARPKRYKRSKTIRRRPAQPRTGLDLA
jgi:hypothetical protein